MYKALYSADIMKYYKMLYKKFSSPLNIFASNLSTIKNQLNTDTRL